MKSMKKNVDKSFTVSHFKLKQQNIAFKYNFFGSMIVRVTHETIFGLVQN